MSNLVLACVAVALAVAGHEPGPEFGTAGNPPLADEDRSNSPARRATECAAYIKFIKSYAELLSPEGRAFDERLDRDLGELGRAARRGLGRVVPPGREWLLHLRTRGARPSDGFMVAEQPLPQPAGFSETPADPPALEPVVEIEEEVYTYRPADNGAGPMWCSGSSCLIRDGEQVLASGLETVAGIQPLNNCRWLLFSRGTGGWQSVFADPEGLTREPSPIARLGVDRVVLSANPTLNARNRAGGGPARPELMLFSVTAPERPIRRLVPEWKGQPQFTEHSYRSLAADAENGELILFQNIGYGHAEWTFRDRQGDWSARGRLNWPWGSEYDRPQPVRVCYPNVALSGGEVHFVGVSDIVEPYDAWREYKHKLTGRKWDYDFRRLFYTWSPDIRKGEFKEWMEIASRDKTCGWVSPGDLWRDPEGRVHIVWTERALDERLRQKFFPEARQSHSMGYVVLRQGRELLRRTLVQAEEGGSNEIPHLPRFQVTPRGRLFVFYYVNGSDRNGRTVSENRILEIDAEGTVRPSVRVPLKFPLSSYFTASPRSGSEPSDTLDLLGVRVGSSSAICYARVRLRPGGAGALTP